MYSKDLKYRMYIKHHIYVLLHKYNQYTWLVWNEFYYNNCYLYMSIENNSLFLTIFGSKTFVAWQSTTLKSIWKVKNNSILISLSISWPFFWSIIKIIFTHYITIFIYSNILTEKQYSALVNPANQALLNVTLLVLSPSKDKNE